MALPDGAAALSPTTMTGACKIFVPALAVFPARLIVVPATSWMRTGWPEINDPPVKVVPESLTVDALRASSGDMKVIPEALHVEREVVTFKEDPAAASRAPSA